MLSAANRLCKSVWVWANNYGPLGQFFILFCIWLGATYMWQRLNMKKQRIFRIFKHVVQDENRLLSSNLKIRQQSVYFKHMVGATVILKSFSSNLKSFYSGHKSVKSIWPWRSQQLVISEYQIAVSRCRSGAIHSFISTFTILQIIKMKL